jgi:predicted hotdog family 3-hydroxylacyl-ACP dehydratase
MSDVVAVPLEIKNTAVKVETLKEFLPHRPPAIWIDEVTSFGANDGECKVVLRPDRPYVTDGFVRNSSFVEWIAQSYGYISACRMLAGLPNSQINQQVQSAYLVGIREFKILGQPLRVLGGETLRILVKKTHEIGPLILVEGSVIDGSARLHCKGQLKLFAQ